MIDHRLAGDREDLHVLWALLGARSAADELDGWVDRHAGPRRTLPGAADADVVAAVLGALSLARRVRVLCEDLATPDHRPVHGITGAHEPPLREWLR